MGRNLGKLVIIDDGRLSEIRENHIRATLNQGVRGSNP
nr:MAG TPA: hypothetical protein [Caudoviricetes sp.]